jgi:hypothetical protein
LETGISGRPAPKPPDAELDLCAGENSMSDQTPVAAPPAPAPPPAEQSIDPARKLFPINKSWKVASIVAVVMVLLALLGVGLTMANKSAASAYWIALVPVYGLLCIWIARIHQQADGKTDPSLLWRQLFHWIGIGVAIALDFFIGSTSLVTSEGAGINALLLLALGCFLAGVHFEWLFVVVGLLLTLTMVMVVQAEQYLWLIFVVGVAALAVIYVLNRLVRPSTSQPTAPAQPTRA